MRIWSLLVIVLAMGFAIPGATAQSKSVTVVQHAERLRAEHKEDTAAKLLTGYLDKHPEDSNALTALAEVRVDQGDTDEAVDLLTHALAASPNSEAANLTLGNLLLEQHHYPEAMDRFETVLAIDLQN
ncbi:MAG: tetratricopeptide repeat protein, partial [Acidobacteriaceae bacterium]